MSLNPWINRYIAESVTAGHIVISYGEIEARIAALLGNGLDNQDTAFRMMFRISGETARIGAADAIMRPVFEWAGLKNEYSDAIGGVRFCISLRNQFAHCHWGDDPKGGVFFTNLQEPAKAHESFAYWWLHLDFNLLDQQWNHMQWTSDYLDHINFELLKRLGRSRLDFPRPEGRAQPRLHNPPLEHIPPWLSPDEQQRHIEHFLELEPEPRQPKQKEPSTRERRESKMWRAELNAIRRRLIAILRQEAE